MLPDSRTCRIPTAEESRLDADLDRICEESWIESMTLRLDPILDWRDVDILGAWDSSTLEGIVETGSAIEDIASTIADELANGKTLKLAIRKAALGFVASEAVFYIKNASQNQVWARISPVSGCQNVEQITHDSDTGWVSATTTVSSAENIDGYKTITIATIDYCTNNPSS